MSMTMMMIVVVVMMMMMTTTDVKMFFCIIMFLSDQYPTCSHSAKNEQIDSKIYDTSCYTKQDTSITIVTDFIHSNEDDG
jgi:hypothetical protein